MPRSENQGRPQREVESLSQASKLHRLQETKNDATGYGLGTTVNWRDGAKMYSHTGGGYGCGSEMYWLPDYGLGLVVLNNNENGHLYSDYSILKAIGEFLEEFLEKSGVSKQFTTFKYNPPI